MEKLFVEKTVFITGGGTGIGQACAIAFAAQGAIVTIAGRTEATLKETVGQIEAAGGKARYAICDVTNEEAVKEAVAVAIGDTGRLDITVNSAGIADGGMLAR
ncbi:SDR family NAD(P)-dependent oxidoreductase [Xanthobacter sediminis]